MYLDSSDNDISWSTKSIPVATMKIIAIVILILLKVITPYNYNIAELKIKKNLYI